MTENMADRPVYLDSNAELHARVNDLLQRMTLEEKIHQMTMGDISQLIAAGDFSSEAIADCVGTLSPGCLQDAQFDPPISSRRSAEIINCVQRYLKEKTRLGIPAMVVAECLHGHRAHGATVFPQSIGLASTWNPDLIRRIAAVIAREARSVGVAQALAPDLDLSRDPRWGRVEETYGEDPYLVARLGEAYVQGMQGKSETVDREHLVCTVKHFAAHGSPEGGVNLGPVAGGMHDLFSTYLPPFEAAICSAGALSVMPAYSEYDGVPAHASALLLTNILRDRWNFQGYVFSDFGGVRMLHSFQRTAATVADAGKQALEAGVDLEAPSPESFGTELLKLVQQGAVSTDRIDQAVFRILRVKFLAGLFENPFADPDQAESIVNCADHRQLALEAARESIVLLKNEGALLPLKTSLRRIAVIGPNADTAQLGDYSFTKTSAVSPLQGIRQAVSSETEVIHVPGCNLFGSARDTFREAVESAAKSDVAIVCVGGTSHFNAGVGWGKDHKPATCGEGFDLSDLGLTGLQQELVQAVHATGTPTIVVLIDGRPSAIPWIAEHIPSILVAWYPGEEGGRALADVLFGSVNPSGKLPISFPRSAGHVPCFYNHKPSARGFYRQPGTSDVPGRDYVDAPTNALFSFGHGLSYTTFDYSELKVEPARVRPGEIVRVRVQLKNTGSRAGAEVVQVYLQDLYSSTSMPVKSLKRFARVHLAAGESKCVSFELHPRDLELIDRDLVARVEPGEFAVSIADLRTTFEVKAE